MDPYKILGITREVSDEELKRAYRQQAAKYHPDAGGDAWVFIQVQQAYESIIKERTSNASLESNRQSGPFRSDRQPVKQPERTPPDPSRANSPPAQHGAFLSKRMFHGQLLLPVETIFFALVNLGDILATHRLLQVGGYESNPIANYFLHHYNVRGLVAFKVFVVAMVIVVTQIIAHRKPHFARLVLIAGIVVVGLVVLYSLHIFPKV